MFANLDSTIHLHTLTTDKQSDKQTTIEISNIQ